jgi:hypothetical protein
LGLGIGDDPKKKLLMSIDQDKCDSLTVEHRAQILFDCLLEVMHACDAEYLLDQAQCGVFV